MKRLQIVYTNTKGQLVIPKEYRQILKIDENVPLTFSLEDNYLSIIPVTGITTPASTDKRKADIELLYKTQGKWDKLSESDKSAETKRRKAELNATKKRKEQW